MYKVLVSALVCGTLSAASGRLPAADLERGKMLYENHCTACHTSVVHVRENRRANSIPELVWQITRWERLLQLDWRYQEVADVLYYLNSNYYKFAEPATP